MTDFEKILNSGKLYRVQDGSDSDPRYQEYLQQMKTYNQLGYTKAAEQKKQQILKQLFAEVGDKAYIQAPYYAMWGGHHVHLGEKVYVNFNCTFVDDVQIYIGDGTMIAPNVTIIAASHPVSPTLRAEGYGCNYPVYIGKNVWLAANATVLQGIHVGDNSIIAAGSLVTKDIPANVIAMGTPAKVVRKITADDETYYDHGRLISENKV